MRKVEEGRGGEEKDDGEEEGWVGKVVTIFTCLEMGTSRNSTGSGKESLHHPSVLASQGLQSQARASLPMQRGALGPWDSTHAEAG